MPNNAHYPIQGTRDLYGKSIFNRKYIIDTIIKILCKYNFAPLETPAFERLDLLNGKYGEDGEKLLYKVLNSGDFMKSVDTSTPITPQIAEKALRYDLTIPMMRYVAKSYSQLHFPWRRYQVQPVWRADRPQKGRYREFIQCDADIVGVGEGTVLSDTEMIAIGCEVLVSLGISNFSVHINHIKLFRGLLQQCGCEDRFKELFTLVDKLDKVGKVAILEEARSKGFDSRVLNLLTTLLDLANEPNDKLLESLNEMSNQNHIAKTGLDDLAKILIYARAFNINHLNLRIDPLLARGLSYYTGPIFEIKVQDTSIGSVVGGGRYENMLYNCFKIEPNGFLNDTAVGLSFGVDRIYALLEERGEFAKVQPAHAVFVVCISESVESYGIAVATNLRSNNICTEICFESKRIKKHLEYADKKSFELVIIVGPEEVKNDFVTLKEMKSGTQRLISLHNLVSEIKHIIGEDATIF